MIILAGGSGFIGQNMIKYLLRNSKEHIIVFDNKLSSLPKDELVTNIRVNYFNIDITNKNFRDIARIAIESIDCECNDVTQVWNFACVASPKHYTLYSLEVIDACTIGIKNLIHLATVYNAKLIHISTSEVYGITNEPMHESNYGSVNSFGPRSCYDEGKRIAETILYEYIKMNKNLDVHIFRLFNTFGPHMKIDDGRVISNFIVSALTNKPLLIYGNGCIDRSFGYVDDIIRMMMIAIHTDSTRAPINIGTYNNQYNLTSLANKIIELTSSNSTINVIEPLIDDPCTRRPILTQLTNITKTHFIETDFDESLTNTINYFKNILSSKTKHYIDNISFTSYSHIK